MPPTGAKPVLLRMMERGILETNAEVVTGSRLSRSTPPRASAGPRRSSPRFLKASGKEFSNVMSGDVEEEYFLNL